ncbi:hypothetical protein RAJCM14343_1504 [Rhodococcus aetherivorans]|uniref:Uncharacterized protein n=1 Tax=Rhodococcus aetherivorans TaxID=191292 RepID=A0ABQ0YI92_9NOCA|nr:hypothetical protein RAJCM14343_1504 [Rhodococcus aetherivorans]
MTPLGVAFYDLLTDAPITDGLTVSARASDQIGAFRAAVPTPSGVHAISGLPVLRNVECPRPGSGERLELDDLPSGFGVAIDVIVEDRYGRFLPTAMRIVAPRRGLVVAADALAGCAALAWSVPDDMPMFLMSGPQRSVPASSAVVRACLRDHATMAPAAHAVLVIETALSRTVGVADATGNVLVAFPYPEFDVTTLPGSTPAGSHGIPTAAQHWPVTVEVRWDPSELSFPSGVDIPRIHSVFCQRPGLVFPDDAAAGAPSSAGVLQYGVPLVLASANTAADRTSYLFVEPAA